MSYYINNEELIETILDVNEDIEDRQYALFKLNMRNKGESDLVNADDVHNFCKNNCPVME